MEQDTVTFNNVVYKKNKAGYFKCPYNCSNAGYPAKKWKTTKGFLKHMEDHVLWEAKAVAKLQYEKEYLIQKNKNIEAYIEAMSKLTPMYNIGDVIYVVHDCISKPEYVWKFNRNVRVRYFDYYTYECRKIVISKIDIVMPSLPDATLANVNMFTYGDTFKCYSCKDVFVNEIDAKNETHSRTKIMEDYERNNLCGD